MAIVPGILRTSGVEESDGSCQYRLIHEAPIYRVGDQEIWGEESVGEGSSRPQHGYGTRMRHQEYCTDIDGRIRAAPRPKPNVLR